MSEYKEKIVNIATGEETWRDYTPDEIAKVEKAQAELQTLADAEAQAQAKRFVALAKLEALGLNEADLKALGL